MRLWILILILMTPSLINGALAAKSDKPANIFRIDKPVNIDGILDEEQWKSIPPLDMSSHWPESGKKNVTSSEIMIAYDDNYLYLGARCFAIKEEIEAPTYNRDVWDLNMDQVGLVLDTYNDNENTLIFAVTPTGSRIDVAMFNDGSGEFNLTWNTFWDANVSQDEKGWYIEIRIPFSSLKFQSKDNEVIMGMIVYSYRAVCSKLDTYPGISDQWGFWSWSKPSQAKKVRFQNIKNNRPLYISPYVMGGVQRLNEVDHVHENYIAKNSAQYEGGLDAKYALSGNLTLDVTVNTDFAQVEADDEQVNLTRFSLFFPEKRVFFQERQSNFNFNFGESDGLFYSRQIGLSDGRLVRILGGARLVGRKGKWDVGLMNLQTGSLDSLPPENFGVYRVRRQVFNSNSYIGGIITSRISKDRYNFGYGLDGIIRLIGNDYLICNIAQTVNEKTSSSAGGLDDSRISLSWEKRTYENFSYKFDYDYGGSKYDPAVGFQARRNFTGTGIVFAYGWLPAESAKIQMIKLILSGKSYIRNTNNSVESLDLGPQLAVTGKKRDEYGGSLSFINENITDTFKLDIDAFVRQGDYNFTRFNLYYNTPQNKSLISNFQITAGGFYDGTSVSVDAKPQWSISRYLQLNGFYQFNKINFHSRDQEFIVHIVRFKVLISLNTKLKVSSYLQYNSNSKTNLLNFRLHYNPKDGNDFYLVYNEEMDIKRSSYDFTVPISVNQSILLKYVHTFRL